MYILLCENRQFYVGSTRNLERRLAQHMDGTGANFTRKHKMIALVYKEEFKSLRKAFQREKQIQKWSHAKKEALIMGDLERLKALSK